MKSINISAILSCLLFFSCGGELTGGSTCGEPCEASACMVCEDATCVFSCGDGTVCNGMGDCVACEEGECVDACGAVQVCNGQGSCVSDASCNPVCDAASCMACSSGECLPVCAVGFVCEAGRCVSGYTCAPACDADACLVCDAGICISSCEVGEVCDGSGTCGNTDAPVAVADVAQTIENESVVIDVLANDSDPNGDLIHVESVTDAERGSTQLEEDGRITYTPPALFNGVDTFSYTVTDDSDGTTSAMVTVTIEPVGADYYVALDGNDSNPGTVEQPFRTLERARTALREHKASHGLPAGGVTIWLRGGTYERTESFVLESQDSGELDRPVVFIGYPRETARIVGGSRLAADWFSPVTAADSSVWARLDPAARDNVMQVDLDAHGISNYGQLLPRGFTETNLAALEISFNGEAMVLARWPDRGETNGSLGINDGFATIQAPVTSSSFSYLGVRPSKWNQAEDIWMHGFWRYWWADLHAEVASINTSTKVITFAQPSPFGIEAGKVYYAENLLEEITVPGEWYLNRNTGMLYFWPPSDLASGETVVSTMTAIVIRLDGASYVQLQDLSIESGRGILAQISGGSHNQFVGCHLNSAGTDAIWISGMNNGIERSTIAHSGNAGVKLFGGNRTTLTPANNFVRNCDIHHFGRWAWMYSAAVDITSSVGHVIANNELHHAPHSAIIYKGNDHLIELNDIHDVCKFSSDSGAIYTGHNWGFRGNLIRHNFIHHISSSFDGYGVHGVYMDGCGSGTELFGNIFYEIDDYAIANNGGRDNIMHNNVMAHCGLGLSASSRGLVIINNNPGNIHNMLEKLSVVPYQGVLWTAAYPDLALIPNNWATISNPSLLWLYPEGCLFSRNIGLDFEGTEWSEDWLQQWNYGGSGTFNKYREMIDNIEIEESDPLFMDEAGGDFSLDPTSQAFTISGFEDIPFYDIGLP